MDSWIIDRNKTVLEWAKEKLDHVETDVDAAIAAGEFHEFAKKDVICGTYHGIAESLLKALEEVLNNVES